MASFAAWLALFAAVWAVVEARRARVRARVLMATLIEVVDLIEAVTDEGRALPLETQFAEGAAAEGMAEIGGHAVSGDRVQVQYHAPAAQGQPGSGIRGRIMELSLQGASITQICRALGLSKREVALGLALEGQGRSAAR